MTASTLLPWVVAVCGLHSTECQVNNSFDNAPDCIEVGYALHKALKYHDVICGHRDTFFPIPNRPGWVWRMF